MNAILAQCSGEHNLDFNHKLVFHNQYTALPPTLTHLIYDNKVKVFVKKSVVQFSLQKDCRVHCLIKLNFVTRAHAVLFLFLFLIIPSRSVPFWEEEKSGKYWIVHASVCFLIPEIESCINTPWTHWDRRRKMKRVGEKIKSVKVICWIPGVSFYPHSSFITTRVHSTLSTKENTEIMLLEILETYKI